jgi:hypothetical protein
MADDDPLGERLVHGHSEPSTQLRMAKEQLTEPVLGIHVVIGQQPEILEDVRPQVVGFVDHEDGPTARID